MRLDELGHTGHHTMTGAFASDVNVRVVGAAREAVAAPGQLVVELVQHDITEQRRQRGPWGMPSSVFTTTPSGITTLAFSIRWMSAMSRRSLTFDSSRAT
jgi:hypothetical protein